MILTLLQESVVGSLHGGWSPLLQHLYAVTRVQRRLLLRCSCSVTSKDSVGQQQFYDLQ